MELISFISIITLAIILWFTASGWYGQKQITTRVLKTLDIKISEELKWTEVLRGKIVGGDNKKIYIKFENLGKIKISKKIENKFLAGDEIKILRKDFEVLEEKEKEKLKKKIKETMI